MSKFGHERRNRQEKIWKEPTACADGKESPGLWSHVYTHDHHVLKVLNRKVADQQCRAELMEAFRRDVRRWPFIVSDYKFKFSWGVREFSKANGLELPKATALFGQISSEAADRLRVVMQRILRNGIRMHYDLDDAREIVEVYTLNYEVLSKFLQRDDGES